MSGWHLLKPGCKPDLACALQCREPVRVLVRRSAGHDEACRHKGPPSSPTCAGSRQRRSWPAPTCQQARLGCGPTLKAVLQGLRVHSCAGFKAGWGAERAFCNDSTGSIWRLHRSKTAAARMGVTEAHSPPPATAPTATACSLPMLHMPCVRRRSWRSGRTRTRSHVRPCTHAHVHARSYCKQTHLGA